MRVLRWSLIVIIAGGWLASSDAAAEEPMRPVKAWQIKGILAALKDEYPEVRGMAADKLAELLQTHQWTGATRRLADQAKGDLRKLLGEKIPYVKRSAIKALGWLKDQEAGAAICKILNADDKEPPLSKESQVRLDAVEALGQLGYEKARAELHKYLRHKHPHFHRILAWEALGRLNDEDALLKLRNFLQKPDAGSANPPTPYDRLHAAEVLDRLGQKGFEVELRELLHYSFDMDRARVLLLLDKLGDGEAVAEMCKLLAHQESSPSNSAADALDRVANDRVKSAVRKVLQDPNPNTRCNAARVLARLGDADAVQELRKTLKGGKPEIRFRAAEVLCQTNYKEEALPVIREHLGKIDLFGQHGQYSVATVLGRFGSSEDVPSLLRFYQAGWGDRDAVTRGLEMLQPPSVVSFLQLAYEHPKAPEGLRWLAHYWGGGKQKDEILCAYLGRPKSDPALPESRETALPVLEALHGAWQDSPSRSLQEDVASWMSLLITEKVKNWQPGDKDDLKRYLETFKKGPQDSRVRAYAAGIERVIAPFEIWPPAWARALLAAAAVNLLALLLLVLRPGRGGLENWLPFLGYAGAGAGSWLAGVTAQLQLDSGLLGVVLLAELVLVIAAGLVSPAVLRELAKVEPLNRLAVPLALRLPWSRRRLFRDYVAALRNQLNRDKGVGGPNEEHYYPLPAEVCSAERRTPALNPEPAAEIVRFLSARSPQQGHVLIEATGGRGKSALLREAVRLLLDRFEKRPARSPLPVLLTGTGESIEQLVENALGAVLLSQEFLKQHLEAGDFVVVLDGISESGLKENLLPDFLRAYGNSTALLLGSRPDKKYRGLVERMARWMTVEPCRLDEKMVDKFVQHCGGQELTGPVKAACRGSDGTYLPILVRMAMKSGGNASVSVADIYYHYLWQLLEGQFPDETQRLEEIRKVSRWCLNTYWRDGRRQCANDSPELCKRLLLANVLIGVGGLEPPREVRFFHDSMQSYLTAYGLNLLEGEGYAQFPRPEEDAATSDWNLERVLLRVATYKKFTQSQADILPTGGTELFQMYLAVFTPREKLRDWLHEKLLEWAAWYEREELGRKAVETAVAPQVLAQVKHTRGPGKLLRAAIARSLELDQQQNSLETLGHLYAGIAPLTAADLENQDAPADGTTPPSAADPVTGVA